MAEEKIVRTDNLAHYKELQEQNIQKLIDAAKQELLTILKQTQVKASDTEPENAEDMTVWFDITNKLIKVKVEGKWIPMGAVYQ